MGDPRACDVVPVVNMKSYPPPGLKDIIEDLSREKEIEAKAPG
jgi:hypothetical protein